MSQTPAKINSVDLSQAYNDLTRNQQIVARDIITDECEIDLRKFYRWLKNPHLIRKPDRIIFAKAFGKPLEELFPNM